MNSSITIDDRESMIVSGVSSVESITDTSVCIFTANGDLVIKGECLETDTFDPGSGILHIRGRIDSLAYTTEKNHLSDNIVARLFR